ncbi:hypothetical protein [Janthinobacterium sp. PAMC25594]|uniref:hypothetical protein n=1 Tax=Janthinobacterium sp. PAMC25594 TaxID=2861284 RepID=UPI0035C266A4
MANQGIKIGRHKICSLMRKAALSPSGGANSSIPPTASTTYQSPPMCSIGSSIRQRRIWRM